MQCDTVKIKTAPSAENPEGCVMINASDFNPEVHQLFGVETETIEQKAAREKQEQEGRNQLAKEEQAALEAAKAKEDQAGSDETPKGKKSKKD